MAATTSSSEAETQATAPESDPAMELAVRTLVRMALFNERGKQLLRREDMAKTCLPGRPRLFPRLLEQANVLMGRELGMQLVAVDPAWQTAGDPPAGLSGGAGLQQRRQLVLRKTRPRPASAQTFLLVSSLTPEEHGRLLGFRHPRPVELGLLAVLLLHVRLSGGVLGAAELTRHAADLGYPTLSPGHCRPLGVLLETWARQRYLAPCRPPQTADIGPDETEVSYGWGVRAWAEFPPTRLVFLGVELLEHLEQTGEAGREEALVQLQQRLTTALVPQHN